MLSRILIYVYYTNHTKQIVNGVGNTQGFIALNLVAESSKH